MVFASVRCVCARAKSSCETLPHSVHSVLQLVERMLKKYPEVLYRLTAVRSRLPLLVLRFGCRNNDLPCLCCFLLSVGELQNWGLTNSLELETDWGDCLFDLSCVFLSRNPGTVALVIVGVISVGGRVHHRAQQLCLFNRLQTLLQHSLLGGSFAGDQKNSVGQSRPDAGVGERQYGRRINDDPVKAVGKLLQKFCQSARLHQLQRILRWPARRQKPQVGAFQAVDISNRAEFALQPFAEARDFS